MSEPQKVPKPSKKHKKKRRVKNDILDEEKQGEEEWKLEKPVPQSAEKDVENDKTLALLAQRAVLYVGFGFFVLFSGHAVFRSLLPALKPTSGALLVAANFFTYAIGSLIHPRFLMQRRRLCFTLAALAHAQWIAVLQLPTSDGNAGFIAATTISSIINGFGAGMLWSTQGNWIGEFCTLDDPKRAGHYTGIFLSLYGASGFIGNVAASLTLYFASSSVLSVVWYLFGIALAGALVLMIAPPRFLYVSVARDCAKAKEVEIATKTEESMSKSKFSMLSSGISKRVYFQTQINSDLQCEGKGEEEEEEGEETVESVIAPKPKRWTTVKALFKETIFPRSIPGISALSAVSVFSWVLIPTLCASSFTTKEDGTSDGTFVVPALFALYAFANAVGAPTSSLFLRKFSNATVFSFVSLCIALPLMLYYLFAHQYVPQERVIYALGTSSFLFGIIVGTYNNCLYSLYASTITPTFAATTSLPPENQVHLPGEAYCIHSFLYCVMYTVFSALVAFLPFQAIAGIVAATTIAGSISFMCLKLPKTCEKSAVEGEHK